MDVLNSNQCVMSVMSTDIVIQDMYTGEPFRIQKTLDNTSLLPPFTQAFDGVIFVDGELKDTQVLWTDHRLLELVATFKWDGKPIAAIGTAVPCVRLVSNNRRVSFFPLVEVRDLLVEAGATPSGATMTRDNNIVTGEHEQSAQLVTEQFCKLLNGEPWHYVEEHAEFKPDGRKPRPVDLIDKIREIRRLKEASQ
jgi:hypothetical protein